MRHACELTGLTGQKSATRSHSNVKTLRRQEANLQYKRYMVPELGRNIRIMISGRAVKTIAKYGGVAGAILRSKPEYMSLHIQKIRTELIRKSKTKKVKV